MADGPRRHWCAYQRRCGNAGSLVSTHRRATPRGRPSRGTAGTNPKTGGHQPKDWQALPFNTVGDHEFFLAFGKCVSQVVRGSFILVWGLGMPVIARRWLVVSRHLVFSRHLVSLPARGGWQPQLPCVLPAVSVVRGLETTPRAT